MITIDVDYGAANILPIIPIIVMCDAPCRFPVYYFISRSVFKVYICWKSIRIQFQTILDIICYNSSLL